MGVGGGGWEWEVEGWKVGSFLVLGEEETREGGRAAIEKAAGGVGLVCLFGLSLLGLAAAATAAAAAAAVAVAPGR